MAEIKEKTLYIKSNKMGEGSEELGYLLLRGFFRQLVEARLFPARIILINSGVKVIFDQNLTEELKSLAGAGVEILACGTCLNYYQLGEDLPVGRVSSMVEIAELLLSSEVIAP